jgi:MFS family permease
MFELFRNRSFAMLWVGGLISMMGDWALGVALPIYVYRLTGSPLAISFTLAAEIVPALVLSSLAGVFVDRWNRRTTVIVTNALQAAGLLPLLLVHSAGSVGIVYAVTAFESIVQQFLMPATNALLPAVVAEEDLMGANSLGSIRSDVARLVGPALGGAIATFGGLPAVTGIDSSSFGAAAVMTVFVFGAGAIQKQAAPVTGQVWHKLWMELIDGLRLVRQDRVLSVLGTSQLIMGIGEAVFAVMFVVWVRLMLHGGALQIGWFMSAQAIGGLLGGLVVARYGRRLSPLPTIGVGCVVFALMDISLFTYPLLADVILPGLLIIVAVGIPAAAFRASWDTLMQTRVTDEFRGRVYGFYGMTSGLGFLVGTIGGGMLGGLLGPVLLLTIFQGGSYLLVGGIVLLLVVAAGSFSRRADASLMAHRKP